MTGTCPKIGTVTLINLRTCHEEKWRWEQVGHSRWKDSGCPRYARWMSKTRSGKKHPHGSFLILIAGATVGHDNHSSHWISRRFSLSQPETALSDLPSRWLLLFHFLFSIIIIIVFNYLWWVQYDFGQVPRDAGAATSTLPFVDFYYLIF